MGPPDWGFFVPFLGREVQFYAFLLLAEPRCAIRGLGITTISSYGTTQCLFGVLVVPLTETFQ
jgi:hypothetical protein